MIDALREFFGADGGFQVRFDSTIPSGAKTCHFTLRRSEGPDNDEWARFTELLDERALQIAREK